MQCYQCDSAINGIEACDDRFDISVFCKSNPQTSPLKWNYPCFTVISNFKIHSSEHKGELINCPAEESRGCYIVESETFNARSTKDIQLFYYYYHYHYFIIIMLKVQRTHNYFIITLLLSLLLFHYYYAQSRKDTQTIIFNKKKVQSTKEDTQTIIFSNTWREIDSSKRLHKSGRRVQIHLWHSQGWILCEY